MAAAEEKKIAEAPSSLVKKLEAAIGKENVKTSKMERLLYSHDLAPLPKETQLAFKNIPDVVVRPKDTADVQKIVQIAFDEGIPITPRGASSWGLGGSMPIFGGILIDMAGKMNRILNIDFDNLCATVDIRSLLGKRDVTRFVSKQLPQRHHRRLDRQRWGGDRFLQIWWPGK
jgi:glycolate oxidase